MEERYAGGQEHVEKKNRRFRGQWKEIPVIRDKVLLLFVVLILGFL
jgi:hypothetical protein